MDSLKLLNYSTRSQQILFAMVLRVADHQYEVKFHKFKMADPRWRMKILKVALFPPNLVPGGFEGQWSRIQRQIVKIQDGGSNMADEKIESHPIFTKFGTRGFLGLLSCINGFQLMATALN